MYYFNIEQFYNALARRLLGYPNYLVGYAFEIANEAGYDVDDVAEIIQERAYRDGVTVDKVNVLQAVLDDVVEEALAEIEELTGRNFGDSLRIEGSSFQASIDCSWEARNEIVWALKENKVNYDKLSRATRFVLSQLQITKNSLKKRK